MKNLVDQKPDCLEAVDQIVLGQVFAFDIKTLIADKGFRVRYAGDASNAFGKLLIALLAMGLLRALRAGEMNDRKIVLHGIFTFHAGKTIYFRQQYYSTRRRKKSTVEVQFLLKLN